MAPTFREALFYCLRRRFSMYSSNWTKAHEEDDDEEAEEHTIENGADDAMESTGAEANVIDSLLEIISPEVSEEIVTEVVFEATESRVVRARS
jgi:hypothetical protein